MRIADEIPRRVGSPEVATEWIVSASDFSLLHLKLDRILAGQEQIAARQADTDAALEALIAGLTNLAQTMDVQRELLVKLAEAMSQEDAGTELHELIEGMTASLRQIQADGQAMQEALGRLPDVVSKAAQEGATLAMGGAIDVPEPSEP